MLRNVFTKTLRDQRKSLMFWGIGVAVLALLTVLFYPSISEAEELNELFSDSDALARVFAGGVTDITSPEGFLNSQLYALLVPILFLVFAIGQGSGAIAGEEERGTLDILLSYPTTRLRVLVQKFAAMVVAISVLAFVLWLSVVVGAAIVSMELSLLRAVEVTLSGMLLGVVFGALALMLGSAIGKARPKRRCNGRLRRHGIFHLRTRPSGGGLGARREAVTILLLYRCGPADKRPGPGACGGVDSGQRDTVSSRHGHLREARPGRVDDGRRAARVAARFALPL